MHINVPELAHYLITGMLWVAMSVCVLWMCQQIVSAAASKLLIAVIWLLALCNAVELYLWVTHFSTKAAHDFLYWAVVALRILMLCLVIPKLRQSMWIVSAIILPSFVLIVAPHVLGWFR